MLKDFLKQSWLVILSALIFGLLVAGVNAVLTPKIEQNAREKKQRALQALLPDATDFEDLTTDAGLEYTLATGPAGPVGYAVVAEGSGFADVIRLLVAIGPDGQTVKGFAVLASNETPGFGDKISTPFFQNQFLNAPAENLEVTKSGNPTRIDNQIVAITGATISSEAATTIINQAAKTLQPTIAN